MSETLNSKQNVVSFLLEAQKRGKDIRMCTQCGKPVNLTKSKSKRYLCDFTGFHTLLLDTLPPPPPTQA